MEIGSKKMWKWIGIIGGSLVILAGIIIAVLFLYAKPKIEENITYGIRSNFGKDYIFQYSDYDFKPFGRSVTFHNVKILPDSTNQEKGDSTIRKSNYKIDIKKMHLDGIHYFSSIFNNVSKVSQVRLIEPVITHLKDKDIPKKEFTGLKSKTKKSIFKNIEVINGSYEQYLVNGGKEPVSKVPTFDVSIDSFVSFRQTDTTKVNFIFAAMEGNASDIKMLLPKGMHTLHIDKFNINSAESLMSLNGISLDPKGEKGEIAKKKGHEYTWMKFTADIADLHGMDIRAFIRDQDLIASQLHIRNFDLEAYHNGTLPDNSKVKPMPQEMIQQLDFKISLDSISATGGNITFTEVAELSGSPGTITFSGVSGSMTNLTNMGNAGSANIYFNGNIMGAAALDLDFVLNYDEVSSFTSTGSISTISLPQFNPIVQPAALVRIENGTLNKGFYDMSGNKNAAHGQIKLYYDNLEFEMLDKPHGDAGFVNELLSTLASAFIVNNNNPSGGELKVAEMQNSREPTRFFINYWWKTILTGIRETLGIGSKNKAKTSSTEKEVSGSGGSKESEKSKKKSKDSDNKEKKNGDEKEEDDDDGIIDKIKDIF